MSKNLKTFIFTLVILTYSNPSFSCVNEYRSLIEGNIVYKSVFPRFQPTRDLSNKIELESKLKLAEKNYKKRKTIENYSDYGAELLYSGKYKEAEKIYKEIEKKDKGRYITYSNLGTLYELIGKDKEALDFIQKSYEINSDSHSGSEWIHIEILKEKIKAKGNDKYFLEHNILDNAGYYFGKDVIPSYPKSYTKDDIERTKEELRVQLQERTSFINPQNILVGQLFFELGNMEALVTDVHRALEMYELSEKYGYSNVVMELRKNHFKNLKEKAKFREKLYKYIPSITILLFLIPLILMILLVYRKKIIART